MVLFLAAFQLVIGFGHGDFLLPVIPWTNDFESFDWDVAGYFDVVFLFQKFNEGFFGMDLDKDGLILRCNCSEFQTRWAWRGQLRQWSNFHQRGTCTRRCQRVGWVRVQSRFNRFSWFPWTFFICFAICASRRRVRLRWLGHCGEGTRRSRWDW